jgi:hypothetical protein
MERNMHDIEQMIADAQAREAERRRQQTEQERQETERRQQEKLTWLENRLHTLLPTWLEIGELRIADDGNPALAFRYQDSDYGLFHHNGVNRTVWEVKRGTMQIDCTGQKRPIIRTQRIEDYQWRGKEQLQDQILCAIARLAAYPDEEQS